MNPSYQFGSAKRRAPQILMFHEIVNDTVGAIPVAVTFCPVKKDPRSPPMERVLSVSAFDGYRRPLVRQEAKAEQTCVQDETMSRAPRVKPARR